MQSSRARLRSSRSAFHAFGGTQRRSTLQFGHAGHRGTSLGSLVRQGAAPSCHGVLATLCGRRAASPTGLSRGVGLVLIRPRRNDRPRGPHVSGVAGVFRETQTFSPNAVKPPISDTSAWSGKATRFSARETPHRNAIRFVGIRRDRVTAIKTFQKQRQKSNLFRETQSHSPDRRLVAPPSRMCVRQAQLTDRVRPGPRSDLERGRQGSAL